jgi:hypothetical protein
MEVPTNLRRMYVLIVFVKIQKLLKRFLHPGKHKAYYVEEKSTILTDLRPSSKQGMTLEKTVNSKFNAGPGKRKVRCTVGYSVL